MNKTKALQAGLVSALCAAIVLIGSFAWVSFTQSALNIFEGFTNPDVNLHDDYDKDTGNKDVYVENSGEKPLYIRVRFDEYMQIGNTAITDGHNTGHKSLIDEWNTHKYTEVPYICGELTHDYYTWIMGNQMDNVGGIDYVLDPDGGQKYYLPAPFSHQALFDAAGNQMRDPMVIGYDHSVLESEQVKYGSDGTYTTANLQSPEKAYARIQSILDAPYTGVPYDPTASGVTFDTNGKYLDYLYNLLDNSSTLASSAIQAQINKFLDDNELGYWDKVYSVKEGVDASDGSYVFDAVRDLEKPEIVFVRIARTQQTVEVYTIAQWIAAGTPTGKFWIIDTDGWCYWGEILLPGQATGLLLSEVLLDKLNAPEDVWYYGINVKLEAATYDDTYLFDDPTGTDPNNPDGVERTITERGEMVLMAISGKYAFDMEATKSGPSDPVYTFNNYNDNVYQLVTDDGVRVPYAPLFVYTGDVVTKATGDLYKCVPSSSTSLTGEARYGSSEYRVGATFIKDIPFGTPGVTFTVANVGNDIKVSETQKYGESYNSGVVEGPDGKHYIKLTYKVGAETKVAWLSVGASKKFEPLRFDGTSTYADDLNQLIWTVGDEIPDSNSNNISTSPIDNSVKIAIGETYTFGADAVEWLVLSKPTTGTNQGKTLLITKDVISTTKTENDDTAISLALAGVEITDLKAMNGGSASVGLLTIQEAIDSFANNEARIVPDGAWWIKEGVVTASGALSSRGETSQEAYIRAAVWVNSTDLTTYLNTP